MAAMGTPAADSDAMKNRRRTTTKSKRPSAPRVSGRRKPSNTNADTKNALLKRERDEALEQQKATAEVLRVISASPGDVKPVFDAILANATRLCDAKFGTLYLYDGRTFSTAATHNAPAAYVKFRMRGPIQPGPDTALDRVVRTKRPVHIPDITKEKAYLRGASMFTTAVKLGGYRSLLSVPMLQNGKLIGIIAIQRQEVQPFSDKQIELVTNFAAQAVIAIENTRLLNELRQSLEQQTATADVLRVISSSPGELEPVFETMLANATQICEAPSAVLWLAEGRGLRSVAARGVPEVAVASRRQEPLVYPHPNIPLGRVMRMKQTIQIVDLKEDISYIEGIEPVPFFVDQAGARSLLMVPMLKENVFVGTIAIYRPTVRPFTDKQIALVQNFAAQAVIAIENTRLLNELRQRTDDLTESLEQQTATSEVLKVISSSPGELGPVFEAMLANAVRLCGSSYGALWLSESDAFRTAAFFGDLPPSYTEAWRVGTLFRPPPEVPISQVARTHKPAQIADLRDTSGYRDGLPLFRTAVDDAGILAVLAVPMLKDDELVGAIVIYRTQPDGFTEKQVELVFSFAAQAVIAIENTRLLNELREVAGAADGDGGRIARHQRVARRIGAGFSSHAGKRGADLQRPVRQPVAVRRA